LGPLNSVRCKLFSVRQKGVGADRRKARARPRPYADPYSTLTDELTGSLSSWSDDDQAKHLIYNNDSMSDIVSQ